MTKEQTLSHYSSQLEIARLMEENERLRKDAERYLWLCSDDSSGSSAWDVIVSWGISKEECDAAIDAAIDAALMGEKK